MAAAPQAAVFWFDGDPRQTLPENVTPLTSNTTTDVGVFAGGFIGLRSASDIERLAPGAGAVLLERESTGGRSMKE